MKKKQILDKLISVSLFTVLLFACNYIPNQPDSSQQSATDPKSLPKFSGFSPTAPSIDFEQGIRMEFDIPEDTVKSFLERNSSSLNTSNQSTTEQSTLSPDNSLLPILDFKVMADGVVGVGYPDAIRVNCKHDDGTKYPSKQVWEVWKKDYYELTLSSSYIYQDIKDIPVGGIACHGMLYGRRNDGQMGSITSADKKVTIKGGTVTNLYFDFEYQEPNKTGSLRIGGKVRKLN